MSFVDRIRTWARKDTHGEKDYSPVGQLFHWTMAALVFFQLWLGWWVGRLPVGPEKLEGYQVHGASGVLLLVLVLLRGLWRLMVPGPQNDADKPGWQSAAAHLTHYVFYLLLIALPISGWAMWSSMAADQPLTLAGVAPWPMLPLEGLSRETRWAVMQWAETIHFGLVIALLILVPLHVGAALKHHFIDRDDVLAAMVPLLEPLPKRPGRKDREGSRRSATPPRSRARSGAG